MTTITIQILKTNGHSAPGNLADAEIHFTDGELDGLKLVGFAIWRPRDGGGQNVSFPSRQFTVQGERRSFSLPRGRSARRFASTPPGLTVDKDAASQRPANM